MVATSVKKSKKFKILFSNKDNDLVDINYQLHDSPVAVKWANKVKHLKHIEIDPVESHLVDLSNIRRIYTEFCQFAGLQPISIQKIDQDTLNLLHEIYENHHQELSARQNNAILYKFHNSIHANEGKRISNTAIYVGWGTKEGPLTEKFDCYPYYAGEIKKNNLYLPWSELGKRPFDYWVDQEPGNQQRFNKLCVPHITLRAKFMILLQDELPNRFPDEFIEWFATYKQEWINLNNIEDYTEIHQQSAPLLAQTDSKQDLTGCKFEKIEI